MTRNYGFVAVLAVSVLALAAPFAQAQAFLTPGGPLVHNPNVQEHCQGGVTLVGDVGVEGRRSTAWNFGVVGGGGEGGRFDPTPVLQTKVQLTQGCLNAHFSAIVGSRGTYGAALAPTALFQVSLSAVLPAGGLGPPQHLYGHWETPYGAMARPWPSKRNATSTRSRRTSSDASDSVRTSSSRDRTSSTSGGPAGTRPSAAARPAQPSC